MKVLKGKIQRVENLTPMYQIDTMNEDSFLYICEEIATGKTLKRLLSEIGVRQYVFQDFLESSPDRVAQYERARRAQAARMWDELLDISDNDDNTWRAQLKVQTRRWMMAKADPSRYGESIDVKHHHTVDLSSLLVDARRVIELQAQTPMISSAYVAENTDATSVDVPPSESRDAYNLNIEDILS